MRILVMPAALRTHLYKVVSLAWACRSAGHEVRVAAMPALTPATSGVGLPAVEIGHDFDILAAIVEAADAAGVRPPSVARWNRSGLVNPGLPRENKAGDQMARVRRELGNRASIPWVKAASVVASDVLRFAERWRPQLVLSDGFVFAAPLVSATLGVPLVRYIWGPDMMRHIGYPLQGQPADGEDVRAQWPAELVELYDRFGVEVRNDHAAGTVDPWPGSLQLPGMPGRIPMRFVPYNGAAVAPEWVLERSSRPRVCVTWGTTTGALGGEDVLPRVVQALAQLDVAVVLAVTSADRDRLGAVPRNFRVAEGLPLHLLMPACDAIVNQGGAGALLTAACHGVPQVLMPQTADTPYNAASFSRSGAAIALDVAEATTGMIGSAVTAALTDEAIRAAADKIRDEIAGSPAPAEVVRTLEKLASRG